MDLSTAFDTIDHKILLERLSTRFGVKDKALHWIKSYLCGRTQAVKIGKEYSKSVPLTYGVPQGSVMGPVLFTSYSAPLGDIARAHGVDFELYADDEQLYISFKPAEGSQALMPLSHRMKTARRQPESSLIAGICPITACCRYRLAHTLLAPQK